MPVYIVYSSAGHLTSDMKAGIARAITEAHRDLTGTHAFLAQVIFQEQQTGNVFLGGIPQGSETIFVHALHRLGRSAELKHRLTRKIVDDISSALSLPTRFIWVYVDELPPAQMVEYGHTLPEPGKEAEWLERLPADDRAFMAASGILR